MHVTTREVGAGYEHLVYLDKEELDGQLLFHPDIRRVEALLGSSRAWVRCLGLAVAGQLLSQEEWGRDSDVALTVLEDHLRLCFLQDDQVRARCRFLPRPRRWLALLGVWLSDIGLRLSVMNVGR